MQENTLKVRVCGEESSELASYAINESEKRIQAKEYSPDDIDYIKKLNLKLVDGGLDVSEKELEKLRLLCRLWDVELKPSEIISNRPVIGPIIVAVKKILFPIIRVFLKDSFKQQRDFNAAAVTMLADLLNKKSKQIDA